MFIELGCGITTATISTKGAEIVSFKGSDGTERIWQADPKVWGRHSPVLFPVCCAVKDNSIVVDGVSYPMTKHGFVRDWEFMVAEQDNEGKKVDLVMTPDEDAKKIYPFNYELHVIFEVFEEGFVCTFQVQNKSDKTMPFCIGGHPAFACPSEEVYNFSDVEVIFSEQESGVVSTLNELGEINGREIIDELKDKDRFTLDHHYFDERDTLIFSEIRSRSVKLKNKITGSGIQFDFPDMPVLAIWSMPNANANYVCLEPWHGLPAGINESAVLEDKPFAVKLEPFKTFKCGYSVKLI